MKAIICDEPNQLRMTEMDQPVAGPGETLVRIRRVGVCGTDLHAFRGQQPFFSYPRVLGHELAAEVVEVGDSGGELKAGDPVVVVPYIGCGKCIACRRGRPNCCMNVSVLGVHADGGMREFMSVPSDYLIPAPGLEWEQRALVECLAIGAHAVRRAQIEEGENALVVGCGPIGLGILQFAKAAGANVIGLDLNTDRLDFCQKELGIERVIDAREDPVGKLEAMTDGENATVVFDATGHAGSMSGSLQYVAHSGRLVFVGITKDTFGFVGPEFHKRETTLLGSRNATHEDFRHVIDCLRDGRAQSSCMVTHRTAFDDVVGEFEGWLQPGSGVLKAIVEVS